MAYYGIVQHKYYYVFKLNLTSLVQSYLFTQKHVSFSFFVCHCLLLLITFEIKMVHTFKWAKHSYSYNSGEISKKYTNKIDV